SGQVSFTLVIPHDGTMNLGSAVVDPQTGEATLSTSNLPVGTFALFAHYYGDECHTPGDSPAYSQEIDSAPTSVTLDVQPSKGTCGEKVTLTAQVTPVGATGTVTFNDFINGRTHPIDYAPVDPQT